MAFLLLGSVWCLLAIGSALAPRLGADVAALASHAAAAALLVWARPRERQRVRPRTALVAAVSGFVTLPVWVALVWAGGLALDLPALEAARGPSAGPSLWLANSVLAPLFEELLYRERLLPTLRRSLGAPLALVMTSALFALPHLEPWSLLATFAVGIALGAIFLATGRVGPCVAYHAGLNIAALAYGVDART